MIIKSFNLNWKKIFEQNVQIKSKRLPNVIFKSDRFFGTLVPCLRNVYALVKIGHYPAVRWYKKLKLFAMKRNGSLLFNVISEQLIKEKNF